jgi:Na+/H+-dicarboxylate symporter
MESMVSRAKLHSADLGMERLSLAAMFIAQAANIHVPFTRLYDADADEQGLVAGCRAAALVVLAGTLPSFNLPVEGLR